MMLFYQYTKKKTQDLDRLPFSYYMNNEDELESMLKIIPLATNNTKKYCVGKKMIWAALSQIGSLRMLLFFGNKNKPVAIWSQASYDDLL